MPPEPPIVGLTSLRITHLDHHDHEMKSSGGACDSSLGRDTPLDDLCFPVEILPHLFLGNAQNSGDNDALNRHKIRVSSVFFSSENYIIYLAFNFLFKDEFPKFKMTIHLFT